MIACTVHEYLCLAGSVFVAALIWSVTTSLVGKALR
jgi:hypothetical protein